MDTELMGFNQLRIRAIESKNKIAFCMDCFKNLHSDAPPEDFDNSLGGRIAGIIKQAGGDYCRFLQLMWIASAQGIQGSHLNYIQKMLGREQQRNRAVDTTDRNKFTQGKYGHMVK
jgi:hypothetical protein